MTLDNLPKFEMYEEGSQIRRSSKAVASNIVEGFGRRLKAFKEFSVKPEACGVKHKLFIRNLLSSVCVILWVFASVSVYGAAPAEQENLCLLTVHLQGVFDAKVSLTPFEGLKTINPIAEVDGVKDGQSAKIKIPGQYLPGEFVRKG